MTDAVIGVDGCPGGWVAVTVPSQGVGPSVVEVVARFDELADRSAILIGVDMPIGLSDEVRDCDRAARARLGRRACCVFSAPPRSCLGAPDHPKACRRSLAARGTKISLQAFHLLPKIAEVDAVMSPARVGRIVEIHPELAFASMAGKVLLTPKRTREGQVERQHLLGPWFPDLAEHLEARPRGVKADDLLDAFAVAWSARRVHTGTAERFGNGLRDPHDLPMEIWA